MIASSIAGSTGAAITVGLITSVAAIVLILVTAASPARSPRLDEALAVRVEQRVADLAASGVDEQSLRELVRDAVRLGRMSG